MDDDPSRCERVGVPDGVGFSSKNEIAARQIPAAVEAGHPRGTVLGDAAFGDDTDLRDALTEHRLVYALGVKPLTSVWWDKYQPASRSAAGTGRPRVRVKRDAAHPPINVRALAGHLPAKAFRTVRWRKGTHQILSGRFVARARHGRPPESSPRPRMAGHRMAAR